MDDGIKMMKTYILKYAYEAYEYQILEVFILA